MIRYKAAWLLPISDEPIRDGWVSVENGRVAAIGSDPAPDATDLGNAVILPALVNAHTHLAVVLRGSCLPPDISD